jgi:hypothetical protein
MTDKLVENLKRLEQHADALMRVPANEQGIAGIQAVVSIAILDIKRALEEVARED